MMNFFWFGGMMWMMWYWLISIIFIIWALIDIANARKDTGYKLIWAIIVIFLGLIGVLLYYLIEKSKTKRR